MVSRSYPRRARNRVAAWERLVVVLTPVHWVLLGCTWPHSAWDLANLYLDSTGVPLLGPDADKIVGLGRCAPEKSKTVLVATG